MGINVLRYRHIKAIGGLDMTTLYYTVTESGKLRALKKVNEYEVYEPITLHGKMFERKTVEGLSKLLAKHINGNFGLKRV